MKIPTEWTPWKVAPDSWEWAELPHTDKVIFRSIPHGTYGVFKWERKREYIVRVHPDHATGHTNTAYVVYETILELRCALMGASDDAA